MTTEVFDRLVADVAQARRERDQRRLGVLTLLMSKIQGEAKKENRPAHDGDVITGVTRYRKEVEEMRAALVAAGRPTDEQDYELATVGAYLPQQMTAEELDAEIEKALEGTDRTRKAMGAVMKHLNGGFRGRFDPKATNAAIMAKLS